MSVTQSAETSPSNRVKRLDGAIPLFTNYLTLIVIKEKGRLLNF